MGTRFDEERIPISEGIAPYKDTKLLHIEIFKSNMMAIVDWIGCQKIMTNLTGVIIYSGNYWKKYACFTKGIWCSGCQMPPS